MAVDAAARPAPADWRGVALVVLAATGFSAKAILIKFAYRWPVDPVTLLGLRMALALPFFLVAAWWSTRAAAQRLSLREGLARGARQPGEGARTEPAQAPFTDPLGQRPPGGADPAGGVAGHALQAR